MSSCPGLCDHADVGSGHSGGDGLWFPARAGALQGRWREEADPGRDRRTMRSRRFVERGFCPSPELHPLAATSAHACSSPGLQVYQLLLGITALSLLATPLVIILCSRLLREGGAAGGGGGGGGGGLMIGGGAGGGGRPQPPPSSHGGGNGEDVEAGSGSGAAASAVPVGAEHRRRRGL